MRRSRPISGEYSRLLAVVRRGALVAAVGAVAFASPLTAQGHPGGRYGTVGDMEATLERNRNVLFSVCNGFGTPRKRGFPKRFWAYKHFHCYVVINSPYRQLCLTIHTLRNGRIYISRSVRVQDAEGGDCG